MNNTITTHTNDNGIEYYSTTDENGNTIYSFSRDFEDIWTQDDEDEITKAATTREEITEELAGYDPETVLCDLPEDDFNTGRPICNALRIAGYDEGATTVINNLHYWGSTIAELIDLLDWDD